MIDFVEKQSRSIRTCINLLVLAVKSSLKLICLSGRKVKYTIFSNEVTAAISVSNEMKFSSYCINAKCL